MNGDVSFSFSSPVAGATFGCRLSPAFGPRAGWEPCSGSASYQDLEDGAWNFEVRAQAPGTQTWTSPPSGWLVRVDRTGPAFVLAQGPANVTSSHDAQLLFVPTEGIRGATTCRLDGRKKTDCSDGRFVASGLSKGIHKVRVTATDALGNVGVTTFAWTIDFGAPKVRIVKRPDRFTSIDEATFRLWSRSDPSLFLCRLDGLPEMPCDDDLSFGPLGEGPHKLTVWGLDAALNRARAGRLPMGRGHDPTRPPAHRVARGRRGDGGHDRDVRRLAERARGHLLLARRRGVRSVHDPRRLPRRCLPGPTRSRSTCRTGPGTCPSRPPGAGPSPLLHDVSDPRSRVSSWVR